MAANTISTFSGLLTEAYGDSLRVLVPDCTILYKEFEFQDGAQRVGNLYHQPVRLTRATGVVYDSTGGAFSTSDPGPNPAVHADAQISASSTLVSDQISLAAAARTLGGVKQFVNGTKHVIKNIAEAMAFHKELDMLYGQTSLAATTEVAASGTSGTFVVSAATWAPGMWLGAEGMALDVYATISTASATNTNAAILVTGVTLSTRTVSFSCASGDAAALDALTTAVIFRRGTKTGASSYNEPAGLDKIITNTGTLFNISASTYKLWAGNSYDCGSAPLSMSKIQAGIATAVHAGLNEDVLLVLNPVTWANVQTELTALRMFDSSYDSDRAKSGSKGITFYSQNGTIKFVPHIYCKQGEAFAFPPSAIKRIGSTEPTFRLPGMSEEQLVHQMPSNAGYEFRAFTDQALFCETPAKCVKFTNIVNT